MPLFRPSLKIPQVLQLEHKLPCCAEHSINILFGDACGGPCRETAVGFGVGCLILVSVLWSRPDKASTVLKITFNFNYFGANSH